MRIDKKNTMIVGFLIVLFFSPIVVFFAVGIRINLTPSFPLGLYKISEKAHLKKGDFVLICAPDKMDYQRKPLPKEEGGICENGTTPLLKKIVALAGDSISVKNMKIFVNGIEQVNSSINQKRAKQFTKSCILEEGEVFVMSDYNPLSFDSRYFGALKTKNILYKAIPLYTITPKNKDF